MKKPSDRIKRIAEDYQTEYAPCIGIEDHFDTNCWVNAILDYLDETSPKEEECCIYDFPCLCKADESYDEAMKCRCWHHYKTHKEWLENFVKEEGLASQNESEGHEHYFHIRNGYEHCPKCCHASHPMPQECCEKCRNITCIQLPPPDSSEDYIHEAYYCPCHTKKEEPQY